MNYPIISVIGAGHMGSSLLGGLIQSGHPADKLWVSDKDKEKLQSLQNQLHIHTIENNEQAVAQADIVIFAIKPQIFGDVARELRSAIEAKQPLLISIAAGIRTHHIEKWLNPKIALVRAMPNTPALIGCGASALYANANVTHENRNAAESILRAVGIVVWVDDEKALDVVTALSGSGPAYYFLLMEAMQKTAEELGLSSETARLLTLQTALGAARMAMESKNSPAELRRQVTSPGGTTEKAVSVLEENNIHGIFKEALHAASARSEELASLLGDK